MSNATDIQDKLDSCAAEFEKVKGADLVFAREREYALQALYGNDYITKVAMQNLQSVHDAFLNAASIGLTLHPARKLAYLVPRDGQIKADVSWMGLTQLAVEDGAIVWAQAEIVYARDSFRKIGVDKAPVHECDPFATDRGEIRGAYVVAKLPSGDYLTTTMPIERIYAIRDRTPAWKKDKPTPWRTDEDEMIRKTVTKRGSKSWRSAKSGSRFDRAVQYLNGEGAEGIELEGEIATDPEIQRPRAKVQAEAPAAAVAQTEAATTAEKVPEPAPSSPPPAAAPAAAADTGELATGGERAWLRAKLTALKIDFDTAAHSLGFVGTLESLTKTQFTALRGYVSAKQRAA